jgi:hypothetical protein
MIGKIVSTILKLKEIRYTCGKNSTEKQQLIGTGLRYYTCYGTRQNYTE